MTVPVKITAEYDVEVPETVNFLRVPTKGRGNKTIDVADVSDETLREIGERWTEALIENARERRKRGGR